MERSGLGKIKINSRNEYSSNVIWSLKSLQQSPKSQCSPIITKYVRDIDYFQNTAPARFKHIARAHKKLNLTNEIILNLNKYSGKRDKSGRLRMTNYFFVFGEFGVRKHASKGFENPLVLVQPKQNLPRVQQQLNAFFKCQLQRNLA